MLDCLKRKEEDKRLYRSIILLMKTKKRTDEFAFTKINIYDDNIYISAHSIILDIHTTNILFS
jgi:hypothetical protein